MRRSWQYSAYSITKYNPIYRDNKHAYVKDEWTSITDIGKIYDGKPFTIQEYLDVEAKYIEAIKIIMGLNNCNTLYIRKLKKHKDISYFNQETSKQLFSYYESLKNGLFITAQSLPFIMKIILRNLSWCELVNIEKKLYVRFGYDYYMFVNTKVSFEKIKKKIEEIGLYVEK